jgi:hypothetical protein
MEIFDAEGRTIAVVLENGVRLLRPFSGPVEECPPIQYDGRIFKGNNLDQDDDDRSEPVPLSGNPAVIYPDGTRISMSYGRVESPIIDGKHQPALITGDGEKYWYHKGRIHCFTEDGVLLPSVVRTVDRSSVEVPEWRNSAGLLHSRYGAKIVPAIGDKYYLNGTETPLEKIEKYV